MTQRGARERAASCGLEQHMNLKHITSSRLAAWPAACLTAALSLALSACGGGGGGDSAPAVSTAATQDVTVQFAASVVDTPVDCSSTLTLLGSPSVNARLRDLRFYLSNVRLVSSTGTEVPITLTTNNYQQGSGVNSAVLIDLTDDTTGNCALLADRRPDLNKVIVGKVPPGTYVRFKATVGLSDALNHGAHVDDAVAPLDLPSMGWTWQDGYKFIKLELDPVGGGTNFDGIPFTTYEAHIASKNCTGLNAAATCTNANMVSIDIPLNLVSEQIALDLNEVFRGVDLATNATGVPVCHSDVDDTDCARLFTNLGLNLSTGANLPLPAKQQVFRAIPK
jgi:uncharacterized repeat protein (TIGR04052 family)